MKVTRKEKAKTLTIRIAANEACRRIRVEAAAVCGNPFCRNRRCHLASSGRCIFLKGDQQ